MDKPKIVQRILDAGVFAIIRSDSSDHLVDVAGALCDGGIDVMEVTMTTPGAMQVIAAVKEKFGDRILMGAGSVLEPQIARAVILTGAEFIVTPVMKPDIVRICNRYLKPVVCGAYTPTEAFHAHEVGADFIKIFPAEDLGPRYIKNLLAPMPMLKLIPAGGVTAANVGEYFAAGSPVVSVASSVLSKDAIKNGDLKKITQLAAEFVEALHAARKSLSS